MIIILIKSNYKKVVSQFYRLKLLKQMKFFLYIFYFIYILILVQNVKIEYSTFYKKFLLTRITKFYHVQFIKGIHNKSGWFYNSYVVK